MPPLTRALLKAGFLALLASLGLELLQLRPAGLWPALPGAALHLLALHLVTVGWLFQVITGVAFWMFPKHPTHPPRGPEWLGWAAFLLMNTGLGFRLAGEPWRLGWNGPAWPLQLSALLQLAAVACATTLLWPRIRGLKADG